jgi:hypothetical protein
MKKIEKFTFGVGDRFAHQASAQLQAFLVAAVEGVDIVPVWNKSNREHTIIGSEPAGTRAAADAAGQGRAHSGCRSPAGRTPARRHGGLGEARPDLFGQRAAR